MNRPFKTPQELIAEGYNAEGALVFLKDFIEEEKEKQLRKIFSCPQEDLPLRREIYKYICELEKTLQQKVETGIYNATEQFHEIENSEGGSN